MSLADDLAAEYTADEPDHYRPRIEFDGGKGTFDTGVIKGTIPEDFSAIFRGCLESAGYNPDKVRLGKPLKESHWQQRGRDDDDPIWLHAFRFEALQDMSTILDLESIVKASQEKPEPGTPGHWFVFQAADTQIGKRSRDGSTKEIVESYCASVESAKKYFKRMSWAGIEGIQISVPGDCIEGVVSQGGKNLWLTQESITEQVRILRRLLMFSVESFAPLVDKVYLDVVGGNHDCLDMQTRCVTRRGFVQVGSLMPDDEVLSVDDEGISIWLPINKIIRRHHSGVMHHIKSRGLDMLVTPGHRVVGRTLSGGWTERLGSEVASSPSFKVIRAGHNPRTDAPISDSRIKLYAWCLTDSHKSERGYWRFYQKQSGSGRILSLLDELKIPYSVSTRSRKIEEICGKRLKKAPEPDVTVRIPAEESRKLDWDIDRLDDLVWTLSERQVQVFLDELIFCDGSWQPSHNSCALYGNGKDEWWDDLRILLAQNGYRTSISEPRVADIRMNISKMDMLHVRHPKDVVSEVDYDGDVWCLQVDNGRFFIERNGKIQLTGNCAQRELNYYPGNNWATESAIAVGDALKMNPVSYGHVQVRIPEKWSGMMTVPVGDSVVTIAHGHQWRKNGAMQWWADQAVNMQPAGASQILQHGHWHQFQLGSNKHRTVIGSPTFDMGSDWLRQKNGATAKQGALAYLLSGGEISYLSLV